MAAKAKTAFFCRNCGFESPKWQGKCPSCAEWNTFTEEVIERPDDKEVWKDEKPDKKGNFPLALDEIAAGDIQRIATSDLELNRTLGGGIVPGSLVLVGGEPGIGKSTLMLQLAIELKKLKVLYVSGEESEQQIKNARRQTEREKCQFIYFYRSCYQ
jgi:DNA repair protein RadA/Sms